jgi:hypothetical protein
MLGLFIRSARLDAALLTSPSGVKQSSPNSFDTSKLRNPAETRLRDDSFIGAGGGK